MPPKTTDTRFARLQTDPRFRRPKQKNVKVEIDDRFKDVLQSEEFGGKGKGKGKGKAGEGARVDKRGRPIAATHEADQLKRFYRLKSPSPSGDQPGFVDFARGEGNLESSGSEDEDSDLESEIEEEQLELGGKKLNRLPQYNLSSGESESGSESDGSHLDIDLSETEDVNGQADDQEEEDDQPSIDPTKRIAAVNLDWDNLRAADLYSVFNSFLNTKRNGESSAGLGKLLDVKIYPSQFGKERMEKEEQEGPGGGIFAGNAGRTKKKQGIIVDSDDDEDEEAEGEGDEEKLDFQDDESLGSDDEADGGLESGDEDQNLGGSEVDDEEEGSEDGDNSEVDAPEINGLEILSDVSSEPDEGDIDMDKLREYQLERLRYYYAIASFSSVAAAEHVMTECNGTEFERTANMFDLSYVPDEMDFGADEVKDEATKELKGYKGNDFVTDALRHSKVKLTWDQDDPNRAKMTRRTLTREEIDEEDFNNLVAGSSGSEDDEETKDSGTASGKKTKKDRSKDLRALLFNNDGEDEDVWGKAGTAWKEELAEVRGQGKEGKDKDMEITFRPALSGSKALDGADEENMTTLEKYQLRMKERKARKKEKRELKRAGKGDESDGEVEGAKLKPGKEDDFFGDSSDSEPESEPDAPKASAGKKDRKTAKTNAPAAVGATSSAPAPTKSKAVDSLPEDLPVDLDPKTDHFSMKDILRAEKEKGKRKRNRSKKGGKHADEREVELGPDGWKVNVKDDRFKVLHEEPEFAIDPSNPAFTKTQGMKDLLAERARVRATQPHHEPSGKRVFKEDAAPAERELSSLVQSAKRRADGQAKPRKRSRK